MTCIRSRWLRLNLAALIIILWLAPASAFTPRSGDRVTAKTALPLRATPPQARYLVTKGNKAGIVRPGETVTIEATKQVKSLFRNDTWIKIKRQGSSRGPKSGWVFFGTSGRPHNFEKRN